MGQSKIENTDTGNEFYFLRDEIEIVVLLLSRAHSIP